MKAGRNIAVLAVSLLAVLVLVLLWIGRGGREPEKTEVSVTEKQAMTFAEGEIRRIAGEGGPDCTWDDTTVILLGRPLYGPDDRCNGYVCRLTTGGMETGYLQVDGAGGGALHRRLLLRRYPGYEGLAEEGGGTVSEKRLYFFGGISYGVRLEDRELPADGLSGKGERRDGGGAVPAYGGAGAAPTGGVRDDERRILRQEGCAALLTAVV